MKPKTALLFQTGSGLAIVTLVVALNSMRAAPADQTEPLPGVPAAATVSTLPPIATGVPVEEPPPIPSLVLPPVEMSAGMDEVFKLARSGVSEDVLTAFVEKSGLAYQPSADEIIYLKDLGVPPVTIATLIRTGNRDSALATQIEAGEFAALETTPAPPTTALTADATATQNHFAAAPQPLNQTVAATAAPAEPVLDMNYFRSSLSPYGNWVYIDGYGECWQPTIASANNSWRPYYDGGRWVNTDSGWYWLSDYSWGWAPFHYGRWSNHSRWGWVWVPGYTWGPAWVEWRTTSAYCGWAPLPPYYGSSVGVSYWSGSVGFSISWGYYNWIPYRYCGGYYPRHYAAHHGEKKNIYHNSTVVNPTINGNNNTVIVTGPNSTVVANRGGRTESRRVTLSDSTTSPRRTGSGPREYIENDGNTLATFRPPVRRSGEATTGNEMASRTESRRSTATGAASTPAPNVARSSATPTTTSTIGEDGSIYLRGRRDPSATPDATANTGSRSENARSTSTPRTVTTGTSAATTARTSGQHTTVVANPVYRRPATEATPILRNPSAVTVVRQPTISPPAVSGGIRTETPRSAPSLGSAVDSAFGRPSAPRQYVRPAPQGFSSSTIPNAPAIAPARRAENPFAATTGSRTETPRYTPPSASSGASSRYSSPSPSPRVQSPMSAPVIAPPARSSHTAPAPSISAPPARSYSPPPSRAPEPSRSISSPPQSAPSRAPLSPPPSSRGGGGSRGPSRQQN